MEALEADGACEWRLASRNVRLRGTLAVFGGMVENICVHEADSLRLWEASLAVRASFKRMVGDEDMWK